MVCFKQQEIGQTKSIIFTSLVTPDRSKTFDDAGFILTYKSKHVIGTSTTDTTYSFMDRDGKPAQGGELEELIEKYKAKFPLQSPRHILAGTEKDASWNNEILLRGVSHDGDPVKIAGVFVWGDRNGNFQGCCCVASLYNQQY